MSSLIRKTSFKVLSMALIVMIATMFTTTPSSAAQLTNQEEVAIDEDNDVSITPFNTSHYLSGLVVANLPHTGEVFNSGSENKLTSAIMLSSNLGNARLRVTLQRQILGIWGAVNNGTYTFDANGSTYTLFNNFAIATNTNYRFIYTVVSGTDVQISHSWITWN